MKTVVEFLIHGTTEELERAKQETERARGRQRRECEGLWRLVEDIRRRADGADYGSRER